MAHSTSLEEHRFEFTNLSARRYIDKFPAFEVPWPVHEHQYVDEYEASSVEWPTLYFWNHHDF